MREFISGTIAILICALVFFLFLNSMGCDQGEEEQTQQDDTVGDDTVEDCVCLGCDLLTPEGIEAFCEICGAYCWMLPAEGVTNDN